MKYIPQVLSTTAACFVMMVGYAVQAEARSVISDIELGANGTLSGQVVTQQGQPVANRDVTLKQGETAIAHAKTDDQGNFVIAGLNNGIYELHSAGKVSVHRLWTQHVAPPAAHRGIMVVSGTAAVRGQAAALGGLGGVGTAAAATAAGYFVYDEYIDDDKKPAS